MGRQRTDQRPRPYIEDALAVGIPANSIVRVAADGLAAKDLRTIVQHVALPPVPDDVARVWLFDEISAVTGQWDQQIKWLRDNDMDFRRATIVLTGSNAIGLSAAAGALAGRRGRAPELDRTLLPVGFATFVELVSSSTPPRDRLAVSQLRSPKAAALYRALLPWLDDLGRLWERYLLYGGFPRCVAAAASGHSIPEDFVEDVFNVVAGDAFQHSRLNTATEMALLERLWSAMGSPANLSNVGSDLDLSHDVVARHVNYLENSYLIWRCPQRSERQWLARERAQEKLYAIDPLLARLAHLRNPARVDIDPTVLTEMQIGMAIRRNVATRNAAALNDHFLFYVRTPTRKEIDFVAEELGGVAIEGKYVEDGRWRSEAATVDASVWDGILCTRNVLDVGNADAWAVPAAILAYTVDT